MPLTSTSQLAAAAANQGSAAVVNQTSSSSASSQGDRVLLPSVALIPKIPLIGNVCKVILSGVDATSRHTHTITQNLDPSYVAPFKLDVNSFIHDDTKFIVWDCVGMVRYTDASHGYIENANIILLLGSSKQELEAAVNALGVNLSAFDIFQLSYTPPKACYTESMAALLPGEAQFKEDGASTLVTTCLVEQLYPLVAMKQMAAVSSSAPVSPVASSPDTEVKTLCYNLLMRCSKGRIAPQQSTAQNNFAREFLTGSIHIQGVSVSVHDSKSAAVLGPADKEVLATEYIHRHVTNDPQWTRWILYNAHMGGPAADLVANLLKVFYQTSAGSILFSQDQTYSKLWLYSDSTIDGQQDVFCLLVQVAYAKATQFLADGKTREISHQSNDPVAVYEMTIKAEKLPKGIKMTLESEGFKCHHAALRPYFEKVEQRMIEAHQLQDCVRSLMISLRNDAVKEESREQSTTTVSFWSNKIEGATAIEKISALSKTISLSIKQDMAESYQLLQEDFLRQLQQIVDSDLASPRSGFAQALKQQLQTFIETWQSPAKQPKSVASCGKG